MYMELLNVAVFFLKDTGSEVIVEDFFSNILLLLNINGLFATKSRLFHTVYLVGDVVA